MHPRLKSLVLAWLLCLQPLLLVESPSFVLAQNSEADTLTKMGKAQQGFINYINIFSETKFYASVDTLEQALAIHQELKNQTGIQETMNSLAIFHRYINNENWQSLLNPIQSVPFKKPLQRAEITALALTGLFYAESNKVDQGLSLLNQALKQSRQVGDRVLEIEILLMLASAFSENSNNAKAIELLQDALKLAEAMGSEAQELDILASLLSLYRESKITVVPSELVQQGLKAARTIQEPDETLINTLLVISNYFVENEQYLVALQYQEISYQAVQNSKNSVLELNILTALSLTSNAAEKYHDAIEYANLGLLLTSIQGFLKAEFRDDCGGYADSFNTFLSALISAHNALGNYKQASDYAKQSNSIKGFKEDCYVRSIQPDPGRAIREVFSKAYNPLGDPQEILQSVKQPLELVKQPSVASKQAPSKAFILAAVGRAYASLGEYSQAIVYAKQGLNLSRATLDLAAEMLALTTLGSIYSSLGDYQNALSFLQQGQIVTTNGYWNYSTYNEIRASLISTNLSLTASIYLTLKQYSKALDFGWKGLAAAQGGDPRRRSLNSQAQLFPLLVLSSIYFELGNEQKVISLSSSLLKLPPTPQPKVCLKEDLPDQGNSYSLRIRCQSTALAVMMLSLAHFRQKNYQKAIQLSAQALEIARKAKVVVLEATALLVAGVALAETGDDAQAVAYLQQGLVLAQQKNDRELQRSLLTSLGAVHSRFGRQKQAISLFEQSLMIGSDIETARIDYHAYDGLGKAYQESGNRVVAIAFYKEAVNRIERIRRDVRKLPFNLQSSFINAVQDFKGVTTADIYRQLADLLLAEGRVLEAQQVLEQLKVEEIRDFNQETRTGKEVTEITLNSNEKNILNQYGSLIAFGRELAQCRQSICSKLDEMETQLEGLTQQYYKTVDQFQAQISQRLAEDRGAFNPERLTAAQQLVEKAQTKTQKNTILIYPLILDQKLWLLWVAPGGVAKSQPVPVKQRELATKVMEFRQLMRDCERRSCSTADTTKIQIVSQQLYSWLIQPIEPELKQNNVKNLIFALDRVVRYMPMAALYDGQHYLVENYSISTILSADLTDRSDRLPLTVQNTSVAAFGVSEAIAPFNPLPYVPIEIAAIVHQEGGSASGIFSGQEFLNQAFDEKALRRALNQYHPRIVHLATHGQFIPNDHLASFLLLGTGRRLTVEGIRSLPAMDGVDLLVLSACESALGGAEDRHPNSLKLDGVEISSMSYHFLNQQVRTVLASLWQVNDASTSLLMQEFYKNLAQESMDHSITLTEALQNAQLQLLRKQRTVQDLVKRGSIEITPRMDNLTSRATADFSHPYYWAPFILIGNGL